MSSFSNSTLGPPTRPENNEFTFGEHGLQLSGAWEEMDWAFILAGNTLRFYSFGQKDSRNKPSLRYLNT